MTRSPLHVFALCMAFLALWWQPGIFMNDEVAQVAALTSLDGGHIFTQGDLPAGYDPLLEEPYRHPSIPDAGEEGPFIGSVPIVIAGLPILWILQVVSPLGAMASVGVLAGACVAVPVWLEARRRRSSAWKWSLASFTCVALPASTMDIELATSPALEIAALQFVSMLCVAGSAVLVRGVARHAWGPRAGMAGVLVLLACTPAFFWASNAKYHAATMLAVALGVYAVYMATHGRRWSWLTAGFAVGLGFWIHAPTGLTLVAATGAAGLYWIAKTRSWQPLAGVGAFGVAIVPDLVHRWLYRRAAVGPRYFQESTTGSGVGDGLVQGATAAALQYVGQTPLETWPGILVQLLVWMPYLHDADALPVFVMAPFLVFLLRRWRTSAVVVWVCVVVVTTILGGGYRLLEIGAGLDQRYLAALWPLLALGVAPVAAWALRGWSLRRAGLLVAGGVACSIAVSWVLASTGVYASSYGASLVPLRILGPLVLLTSLLGWAWCVRRRRRPLQVVRVSLAFPMVLWGVVALTDTLHAVSGPYAVWPVEVLSQALSRLTGTA